MVLPAYRTFLLVTALLLKTTACTTLPSASKEYDSFAAYAEAVFRHQNDLTSRLMALSDSEQLEDDEAVEEAEQAMIDACHLLNEYAEMENSGESPGLFFKREVQASIETCDQKIEQLEALLTSVKKQPL